MFCRVKKSLKEYREFQLKMYTRIEDTFEQRLAGVKAAKSKLEEQIQRDSVNTTSTGTTPLDELKKLGYSYNCHMHSVTLV